MMIILMSHQHFYLFGSPLSYDDSNRWIKHIFDSYLSIQYNSVIYINKMQWPHYSDVIMGAMASQITGVLSVFSTVCSGADQRKHQSSASLAFVRGKCFYLMTSSRRFETTRRSRTHYVTSKYIYGEVFIYWDHNRYIVVKEADA